MGKYNGWMTADHWKDLPWLNQQWLNHNNLTNRVIMKATSKEAVYSMYNFSTE